MNNKAVYILIMFSLVAGCATDGSVGGGTDLGGTTIPGGPIGSLPRSAIDDPNSALATRIIYFDFDQSSVRADSLDILAAHGRYLASFSDMKIRLEGHADERGSREYNIALGERRAIAARRQLLLQGARQNQIDIISYGEELPLSMGHNDGSWAENRRVEIIYEAQ